MQYIRGGSLQTKLEALAAKEEMFTTEAALAVIRQTAEALSVAHEAGIVHRDLKPSNILLHPNGMPVLTDLGIASVESATRLTQTGNVLGTPYYMSPEQVGGKPLDGRSDLYSLGIILYELLAGTVPFTAESPLAVLHQHVYESPPSLEAMRPGLTAVIYQLVERCLAKDPANRFQSAAELVMAIDRALMREGGTFQLPPSDTGRQATFQQHTRRSKVLPPVSTTTKPGIPRWVYVVGPLLLLLLVGYFVRQRPGQVSSTIVTASSTPVSEAAETVDNQIVINGTVSSTVAAISLVTQTPEATTAVPTLSHTPLPTLSPTPLPTATPIPRLVFQSNRDGDYDIYIMDADGSNQINLTNNAADDNYPVVSLDGSKVLFESIRDGNWEVYVMNIDGSNPQRLTNEPSSRDRLPTWSPDGEQIAFISDRDGDYDIFIMEADGGNVQQVTFNEIREGHMSWSANDQLVYNAGPGGGVTWDIYTMDSDGSNIRQLTDNSISDWAPEWSPDGRFILYLSTVGGDPAIFVMNADGSNARMLYNSEHYEWGADWSLNGSQIIFSKDENDTSSIYIMNADGTNSRKLTERGGYPSWVR